MGKILGLDLGVSSVGFGIIDSQTYDVIKYGVRLNEEADAENNLKRRTMRESRRLKSRRKNRIDELKNYLKEIGIINTEPTPINNIYEIRVKGLSEKLSGNELACSILNIAKHRGSSLEVAIDEDDTESKEGASVLTKNTIELRKNDLFVCQHQLNRLKQNGILRSYENVYKMEDYERELNQILSNQDLTSEQISRIIVIVSIHVIDINLDNILYFEAIKLDYSEPIFIQLNYAH